MLMALVAGGLVYLGVIIYPPIYSAIMSWGESQPVRSQPEPDPNTYQPAPTPDPDESVSPVRGPVGAIRAIYAPPALLDNQAAFDAFLDSLPGAGLNAVMVDIKDADGTVLHTSSNENAQSWGAIAENAFDLAALNDALAARGLHLVARLSAFRDERAARANPDYAVTFREPGTTWLDNFPTAGGRPWLNPHSAGARQYITDLVVEAARMGAVMVVLDDFIFPPNSLTPDAYFGDTQNLSRGARLRGFAQTLTETLAGEGARMAIYLPAGAFAQPNDTLYGGPASEILASHLVLGALPYQFPGGIWSEGLTIQNPLESLENTVAQIVMAARGQTDAELMVLLQGGSLPDGVQYTTEQIMAQVDRLSTLGVEEFVFYAAQAGQYQMAS
ncbi:MAG: putative glycoside hydrolase [Oscillospiraceae bacterium]|nr:putative glycoside hydrolase [Oscillospiraceae bacterium]